MEKAPLSHVHEHSCFWILKKDLSVSLCISVKDINPLAKIFIRFIINETYQMVERVHWTLA